MAASLSPCRSGSGGRAWEFVEDRAARLVSPKRKQVGGVAAARWAPGGWQHQSTRCYPVHSVGVSVSGPWGGLLGHYSLGLFRGRSGVRFSVKLVFCCRRL